MRSPIATAILLGVGLIGTTRSPLTAGASTWQAPVSPSIVTITTTSTRSQFLTLIKWASVGAHPDWFEVDRQPAWENGTPIANAPWSTRSTKLANTLRQFTDKESVFSSTRFNYRVCAGNARSRVCSSPAFENATAPHVDLRFKGAGSYAEVPNSPDFSLGASGLTVAAWIRPDARTFSKTEGSLPTEQYVYWLGKGERGHYEWAFRMYSLGAPPGPRQNRISFYVFRADGGRGCGSYFQDPLEIGQWIHVVGVADEASKTTSIFKNGLRRHTDAYGTLTPGVGAAPLRIGTRDFASFFHGAIGAVRLWNRPLSGPEIQALYLSDAVPSNGLAAQFPFTEGTGTAVHETVRSHDGSVRGATWESGTRPVGVALGGSGGGC